MTSSARLAVSVIIPTHDRRASVLRLLVALRDGSFPHNQFHVVVVADGCTDDTVAVLRTTQFPFPVLVLEQSPGRGAAAARNLGAAHATADVLVFIDDDIEPLTELLEAHTRAHERGPNQVVIGPPLPVRAPDCDFDTLAAWGWWEKQFAMLRLKEHRFTYENVFSGNFSMPASLFAAIGGFDVALTNCRDDYELGLRLMRHGADVVFVPEAAGYHHELRDRRRLILRKRAEGKADVFLAKRHPDLWPSLRPALPLASGRSPLGILRRLAFASPTVGDLVARAMALLLNALEYLRMRGTWRELQGGVMYYWYWRGVAETVGTTRALAELAAWCTQAGAEEASAAARSEIDLDLRDGIAEAERRLDEHRPAGARIRFGIHEIGHIPPLPGAEPLRGVHLRARLANDFSVPLGRVLQIEAALTGGLEYLLGNAVVRKEEGEGREEFSAPEAYAGSTHAAKDLGNTDHAASADNGVSVIIPVHNAAETLAETLDCLLAQTFSRWEAIIVDDGSSDDSARIAGSYAASDARIRVITQPRAGAGEARNRGIQLAREEWLYFLDADDWILPTLLERMMVTILADQALDAVHCGWSLMTDARERIEDGVCHQTGDLFPLLARRNAFTIHACVVRRVLVQQAGGFDPSFWVLPDWVLWQRIARGGAVFGAVRATLAHYRVRDNSLSANALALAAEAVRVIELGHSRDQRVPISLPAHADGRPVNERACAEFEYLAWPAGMLMARGQDPLPLLELGGEAGCPDLVTLDLAETIFRAVPVALGQQHSAWDAIWQSVDPFLDRFLSALETRSRASGLARAVRVSLERRILERSSGSLPRTLGLTHAVRVEVTEPIEDTAFLPGVERLHCAVLMEGERLGTLELPVCDGSVPEWVLRDAIADRFAWQIIGRFFERSIYVHCEMRRGARGWSAWLDGTLLAEGLPDGDAERRTALHDKAGWDVFLHELWEGAARPSRTVVAQVSDVAKSQQGWLTVEASAPFPDIVPKSTPLYLQLLIGGAGTSAVSFTRDIGRLGAESIRKTLTDESGYELCRVAVREGLLGAPLSGATSLRARLAAAAGPTPPQLEEINVTPAHIRFAPGWGKALSRALPEGGVAIARHASLPYGSSGSRRATLPSAALNELLQAAEAGGEPTVKVNQPQGKSARRLVYAPELLWSPPTARTLAEDAATAPHEDVYGRHHFEELFARDADPWRYTTPYEREKYERTLKMLPSGEIGNALELACAEGHFTVQLAPRVGRLVAADISEIGLERARTRCADYLNVEFRRLDIVRDPLPSGFELVICSEVLYYAGGLSTLQAVALKLAEAVAPGGHLLVTHANLLVDEPDRTGYDWGFAFGAKVIGETLTRTPLLRHVRELRTPLYRIQLFRRVDGSKTPRPSAQDITETQEVALPEPSVAARIRWNGGSVSPIDTSRPVVTERLPILMYHRVAETVVPGRQRYCVTPAMFEQQLAYLRGAGFRSIRLDEWRDASSARRALPGRAVALTFDGASADFATYAWPLLQRYGFCATVFVVTGQVGRWNNWDEQAGTAEPLMDWDTIVRLSEARVEFGAHSVTHRRLVSLPPVDVVRECAGARAAIVRAIGRPVTSIAYPYGEEDEAVRHLAGACGFAMGMSSRPALATVRDPLLALPRVEVTGFDGLREFVAKLGG